MIRALRAAVQTLLFLFIIIRVTPVLAYETETHAAISQAATTRSGVDQILAESLGMGKGMREKVSGKTLMFRLRSGSIREDDGARFLNHFHNPLAEPWSQAGFLGCTRTAVTSRRC